MRPNQDAFGRALYDYYQGGQVPEIIERDDGFLTAEHSFDHYFATYPQWPIGLKQALKLVRGRVLDIGCGAGRIGLHLQKKGFDVLGIDVSPLALKVCRERGVKNLRQLSIRDLSPGLGPFGAIVLFGNNFGLLEGFNQARRYLRRFHRITTADAIILAETVDPYDTKDPAHLAYHRFNRSRGRMGGRLRLRVRYRQYTTPWFNYLFVSREELRKIVQGTGWRIKRFIRTKPPAYIVVLEKERS